MKDKIKRYEDFLKARDEDGWTITDFNYILSCIEFLQHERLIHLLVTIAVVIVFLALALLSSLISSVFIRLCGVVITILLLFYIKYYCYLENKTQSLYDHYHNSYENYLKQKKEL